MRPDLSAHPPDQQGDASPATHAVWVARHRLVPAHLVGRAQVLRGRVPGEQPHGLPGQGELAKLLSVTRSAAYHPSPCAAECRRTKGWGCALRQRTWSRASTRTLRPSSRARSGWATRRAALDATPPPLICMHLAHVSPDLPPGARAQRHAPRAGRHRLLRRRGAPARRAGATSPDLPLVGPRPQRWRPHANLAAICPPPAVPLRAAPPHRQRKPHRHDRSRRLHHI